MHNGVFNTLREVVEFYNTRDVSDRWGAPEIAANMDTRDTGNLKLTDEEIDALVVFMEMMTDGYEQPPLSLDTQEQAASRDDPRESSAK